MSGTSLEAGKMATVERLVTVPLFSELATDSENTHRILYNLRIWYSGSLESKTILSQQNIWGFIFVLFFTVLLFQVNFFVSD
mgnify:CR=1 FL=1